MTKSNEIKYSKISKAVDHLVKAKTTEEMLIAIKWGLITVLYNLRSEIIKEEPKTETGKNEQETTFRLPADPSEPVSVSTVTSSK